MRIGFWSRLLRFLFAAFGRLDGEHRITREPNLEHGIEQRKLGGRRGEGDPASTREIGGAVQRNGSNRGEKIRCPRRINREARIPQRAWKAEEQILRLRPIVMAAKATIHDENL